VANKQNEKVQPSLTNCALLLYINTTPSSNSYITAFTDKQFTVAMCVSKMWTATIYIY